MQPHFVDLERVVLVVRSYAEDKLGSLTEFALAFAAFAALLAALALNGHRVQHVVLLLRGQPYESVGPTGGFHTILVFQVAEDSVD